MTEEQIQIQQGLAQGPNNGQKPNESLIFNIFNK